MLKQWSGACLSMLVGGLVTVMGVKPPVPTPSLQPLSNADLETLRGGTTRPGYRCWDHGQNWCVLDCNGTGYHRIGNLYKWCEVQADMLCHEYVKVDACIGHQHVNPDCSGNYTPTATSFYSCS
jgi:hypothetical protein